MDDLISRLRALSRHEHSDMTIGDEAADALEAAREDAERYRFLRAEALSAFESGLDEPQLVFARECVGDYQDCIDAATDAAREARNG